VSAAAEGPSCPVGISRGETVILGHGSGGRLSAELLERVFLPRLAGDALGRLEDAATLRVGGGTIALTTDAFVVTPRVFPGGDLGSLAVHGTVNDLAMVGARARYLAASFILEEGLPLEELDRLVESMARAAREAGVEVAAGDTKVVGRGAGDGCYITTTGVGEIARPSRAPISVSSVRPGDAILVSGPIGLHGIAILSCREGLGFEAEVASDSAALWPLVDALLDAAGDGLRALRDPTRGGLASALCEIAAASRLAIEVEDAAVPVPRAVRAACEMLGLDPFYVANEGKLVAAVAPEAAEDALFALRSHPLGIDAARIGTALAPREGRGEAGLVTARTRSGGRRVVQKLPGEQLPRIC
jgi:hydrogenase expression/formation protein HypE